MIAGASSTFSKDVLPRAAALLDAAMVSEVVGVRVENGEPEFRRVMFAGNVIATVRPVPGSRLTVRCPNRRCPTVVVVIVPVRDPDGIDEPAEPG